MIAFGGWSETAGGPCALSSGRVSPSNSTPADAAAPNAHDRSTGCIAALLLLLLLLRTLWLLGSRLDGSSQSQRPMCIYICDFICHDRRDAAPSIAGGANGGITNVDSPSPNSKPRPVTLAQAAVAAADCQNAHWAR